MRMLLVAACVLAFAAPALASPPSESELETELVCLTCHTTLDESDSAVAQQMKAEIRRRIAQGWTKQQILDEMVANYGPGVLSTPATHGFDLLAWLLPLGGIALGAVGLGAGAWYWARAARGSSGGGPDEGPPLDADLDRRVDEELARFNG